MPDTKEILKVVNGTDQIMADTIGNSQVMLKRSIRKLEKRIMAAYTGLTVGDDGNLIGPRVNLKQSQKIHKKIIALFEEEYGTSARRAVKGYAAVDKAIMKEFKAFDIAAEFTSIDADMIAALKKQAYTEYVQFGNAAQEVIAQVMYDTVAAGGSFSELLGTTTGILLGGRDARGRSMATYATQWANDGVMNYHQSVTLKKAQDASLVSFLYYGDIILTSRQFCIDRVGKVYTKKQIERWNDMGWAGKAGAPLTYRGGYNCRHHWHPVKKEWIPEGEIPIQDIYAEQGIEIPRGLTLPKPGKKKKLTNAYLSKHQGKVTGKVLHVPGDELKIDVYDDFVVDKYAKLIEEGNTDFAPVFVNKSDMTWVVDGNHRAAAYRKLGKDVPIVLVDRMDALNQMGMGNLTAKQYYDTLRQKVTTTKIKKIKPKDFVPAKTLKEAKAETQRLVAQGMEDNWPTTFIDGVEVPMVRFNHTGTKASYKTKAGKTMTMAQRAEHLYGPDAVGYIGGKDAPIMQVVNTANEYIGKLQTRSTAYGIPRLRGMWYGRSNSAGASMGDGVLFVETRNANAHWQGWGVESADKAAAKLEHVIGVIKDNIETLPNADKKVLTRYLKIKEKELAAAKAGRVVHMDKTDWDWSKPIGDRAYSSKSYYSYGDERLLSTLEHEFGHHIHQTLFVDGSEMAYHAPYLESWLSGIYNRSTKTLKQLSPTGYGTTNVKEWFAENYSLWQNGRKYLVNKELEPLLKGLDALEQGVITKADLKIQLDKLAGYDTLGGYKL